MDNVQHLRYEVIPSRAWKRDDGKLASVYGAFPWRTDEERDRWSVETLGWTVRNPYTGEVGACRPPWKNKEAAETFAAKAKPSRIPIGS